MKTLPIAICLFTSTKGHFGALDIYKATLTHLDRQIPLVQFGALYAHIKVGTTDSIAADAMEADLVSRGFTVERTVADWSRGTSHQQNYLTDMRRASMSPVVQSQPFVLLLEDDTIMTVANDDLSRCFHRMTAFLDNPDIVTTRFLRASDLSTSPVVAMYADYFFSPHVNMQPLVCRSRDWYVVNRLIETSWQHLSHLQCELVLRLAFNQLTRSDMAHVVWHPDYAHSPHLGLPNHAELLRQYSL